MAKDLASKDLKKRVAKIGFVIIVVIAVLSGSLLFAIVKNGISLYAISGDSMEPTFSNKDSVIISQGDGVEHGQLVFFSKPQKWSKYADQDMTLVKRIVAVEGDTVKYDGKVFTVNGEIIYDVAAEGYECSAGDKNYEHTLTNRELMVFGDNAEVSLDSRRVFCDGDSEDMYVPKISIKNYGEVVFKF